MTEEKEFIMQQWCYLKECQKRGEKKNGVLCLGDVVPGQQYKTEPVTMLNTLVKKGYFKRVVSPDPDKPHCFKFTECGERHVKYFMPSVGKV